MSLAPRRRAPGVAGFTPGPFFQRDGLSTSVGPGAPPAVCGQQLPDMAGVINLVLLTIQGDQSSEGPAIQGGARPARTLHQHSPQRPLLPPGQLERLALPAAGGQQPPDMACAVPDRGL